jgi:glycosyltransferase involved in cell wall biosynthesis
MHLVSLQQAAGVEAHFAAFVRRARVSHPEWSQGWLNPAGEMPPLIAEQVGATLASRIDAKRRGSFKIPSYPAWLRAAHCRGALRNARTSVVLVWNRTSRIGFVLDAIGASRCIHWEHGAAWDPGNQRDRARYLRRIPLAIANSRSSARFLELKWRYQGDIRVCLNALRPSLRPDATIQKRYPTDVIQLGVAARLVPVKGVALVLHSLQTLSAAGANVKLQVAGAGPELPRLTELARKLGIAERCTFHGTVADMRQFYTNIDCLLHPPVTEAFGLVAIEAAAHGCPVIAAAVDGLPEAVEEGVSGSCIQPTLPLAEYRKLGGSLEGLPAEVYDAATDALHVPRVVDPTTLAAAVRRLFDGRERYERLSRSASEHVARRFDFDAHVAQVMSVVAELAGSTP